MGKRGFDPSEGVIWTASTGSDRMQKLVNDREAIFTKQRGYAEDKDRQVRCAAAIAMSEHTEKGRKMMMDQYSCYLQFCRALKVPPHPMSTSMMALFCFAKASWKNMNVTATSDLLRALKKLTIPVWDGTTALGVDLDEATLGLHEFRRERKDVRVRAVQNKNRDAESGKFAAVARGSLPTATEQAGDSDAERFTESSESDLDFGDMDDVGGGMSTRKIAGSDRPHSSVVSAAKPSRAKQLPTPGLPRAGERFATMDDLLVATYKALIPVYGIGCYIPYATKINCSRNHSQTPQSQGPCSWQLVGEINKDTGEIVVSAGSSTFEHNHGADPRILSNPEWRPPVKVLALRRAMGLDNSTKSSTMEKRKLDVSASSTTDSPARSHSESTFKKPRLPSPRATSPVLSASTSAFLSVPSTSTNNPSTSRSPHLSDSLSHSVPHTSNQSIPHPSSSLFAQRVQSHVLPDYVSASHAHLDNASSLPQQLSPSSTDSFLPRLSSFLRSLHPSLDSLANPLFNSGIESLELLQLFCAFESTTIDLYLGVLKERDTDQTISNVHLRLLKKKLGEAQAGEWSN